MYEKEQNLMNRQICLQPHTKLRQIIKNILSVSKEYGIPEAILRSPTNW